MAVIHSITSAGFFRKLGKHNLLAYLEHQKHPLLNQIEKLLISSEELSAETSQQIQSLLHSQNNPKLAEDAENFSKFGSLLTKNSCIKIQQLRNNPKHKELFKKEFHDYDIVIKLFLEQPRLFKMIYSNVQIDNTQRWQFYRSNMKPIMVQSLGPTHRLFESKLKGLMEEEILHLDAHTEENDRWLFISKYPDKPTRVEDFKNGKICPITVHKPIKFMLVFYPKDKCLQIHLHKDSKTLSNQIANAFIETYILNAKEFQGKLSSSSICLERFRDHQTLIPPDEAFKICSVRIIGFEFKPENGATVLVKDIEEISLTQAFNTCALNIDGAELLSVKLLFEFEGRGRSRERRLTISSNGKNNLKGSEAQDEVMRRCLIHWGVMKI